MTPEIELDSKRETVAVEETGRTRTASEREQAIEAMLPLVKHIVSRLAIYLPPHISRDDLASAGVVGLIDAVDRYSDDKGCSLKTYCSIRIRGAILDELRRLDWVPRSVHRDARRLSETQEILAQRLGREPLDHEVREHMGLDSEEWEELLERVKPLSYFSLQEAASQGDDSNPLLHEEVLADPRANDAITSLLKEEDKGILREQLQELPQQQLQVLTLYYMEDLRLKEIAEILNLTESRVSQIHTLAINRLRAAFMRKRRQ
jgi:RNA polymerase sigma factor FliA